MLLREARGGKPAHRRQDSRRLLLHDHATSPAPFDSAFSVRTLRKTPEPGLRAAALWKAEALLAKQEAYTRVETVEPPARQWRLLKRRTPTGLYWLLQQMAAWPRRYTRHQWMDLNSILVLYR